MSAETTYTPGPWVVDGHYITSVRNPEDAMAKIALRCEPSKKGLEGCLT